MENSQEMAFNIFLDSFKKNVSKVGFKNTIQKDYILKTLYLSKKHLTADDVFIEIKEKYNMSVGMATIYNAIKFLHEMHLVNLLNIGDGTIRYEFNHEIHHDHLICTNCSSIIEFTDEIIEEQQNTIAKKYDFYLKEHIMILYGICEKCQKVDSNS